MKTILLPSPGPLPFCIYVVFLQKQTLLPDYLCVLLETFYLRVCKHTYASMCIYLCVYVYGICVFPPCLFLQMGFYNHDSEGYILYSTAYLGHHYQNVQSYCFPFCGYIVIHFMEYSILLNNFPIHIFNLLLL